MLDVSSFVLDNYPSPDTPARMGNEMSQTSNMSAVDVLAVMRDNANTLRILGANGLRRAADLEEARAAVAELIEKMGQIERLSREADPKLVNVSAMLGDIARAALARCVVAK